MDYNLYARKILNLKSNQSIHDDEEVLSKKLNKVFNKRYNAVCIDIDGVLVDENLDYKKSLPILESLLKKHIPIVFATGRGESSSKDYIKRISIDLYSKYNVHLENLKHISCICNNGTILMYTDSNASDKFFTNVELLVSKRSIEKISELYNVIQNKIYCEFPNGLIVDRSYCNTLKCITGIRFIMENNRIKEELWKYLNEYINKENSIKDETNFILTEGEYGNKNVSQIGVADNRNSVLEAEKLLGLPKNSMIRIFDQGDEKRK